MSRERADAEFATRDASRDGLTGPGPDDRDRPRGRRSSEGVRVDPEAEASHPERRATISALVKHEPGVLAEVAGLVSRRRFDIDSLTVGPTTNPETARMTLTIEEPEPGVRQVEKQLEKLVPVISVRELGRDAVRRELAVLKVHDDRPAAVESVAEMFDCRVLDAEPGTVTVEATGSSAEIDRAIEAFQRFSVRELTRTGTAALARGTEWTTDAEEERYERPRIDAASSHTTAPKAPTTDD
ncbi:acetolactate synthase 3 regulatory subunit [Halolamina pelagica]|uniref:Acetolactate synthase 3 regulatory subunit n=1 Tax=Halolamina pelagica TaxID=699431 RepID=A0A0P7I2K6_9EURY|nr:acetolactate synthase small subunit [Halolamina pelagica]KPN31121.1 acetolactate synthase 3 regulatory subunit [Halolamina pelagica]